MGRRSKRYKLCSGKVSEGKFYTVQEAVDILKSLPEIKFDQTVEISIKLGVDSKKSDQAVRGNVILPNGVGKKIKILVFCGSEQIEKAKLAGADFAGDDELIDKINKGWLDFDVAISTPNIMSKITKLGKILGPRKLMPNLKAGTISNDIEKAIKEVKKGKVEFKMDKTGNIHVAVGKKNFENGKLLENIQTIILAVNQNKPSSSKGKFIKNITLSTTMSPGIKVTV